MLAWVTGLPAEMPLVKLNSVPDTNTWTACGTPVVRT